MKQVVSLGHLAVLVAGLVGCGESAANGSDSGMCNTECPNCADADAAELFNRSSIPVFEVALPQERWQHLQDHARDEEYEPACLTFDGEAVGAVGLRFKGSFGTLYPCLDGALDCAKLSMKLKFNAVDKAARFHGLKRLNLHSMLHDATKLKERLGYDLYREMGLESPRSAWAELRINGQSYGLFSMVEQVDGRFTADRWPDDGEGNLFKEAWPQTSDSTYYEERLKTNEDEANVDKLLAFFNELRAASSQEERAAVLRSWMSIEHFQRYMAVDDAIFNCDGVTAFYTDGDWKGNHNYYFYQATLNDHFTIIPWDLDSTFTPWATWSAVPHWTQLPDDCDQTYPTWDGSDLRVQAPGCDPVFQGLASNIDTYRAAIDELLNGPFDEEHLVSKIDDLALHISTAVANDPLGASEPSWQGAVEELRQSIPVLRDRLVRIRDGEFVVPFMLTDANDFEAVSDISLRLGSQLYKNPSTTVDESVNTTDPLAGSQDLRIDFEYRDEGDQAWEQWMSYRLGFSEAPVDMTGMTGIRLVASADQTRTLRIDLSSPQNSNETAGIRRGWDVVVGPDPTIIEVSFQDAVVQSWAAEQGLDPDDPLEDVLASVTGLVFQPICVGRDATGLLGEDVSDIGFLQIDDIQLFTE